MKPKTIVTVVILAFVAASVGYLIVKEVRQTKELEAAREGLSAPASGATGERELETGGNETATSPATPVRGDEGSDEGTPPSPADRQVVVTYYYRSQR
jgi:type II secretory pathway pseudopilin PulG